MYILIVGNLVDGFQFVGPFETDDDAMDFGNEQQFFGADFSVSLLHKIDEVRNEGLSLY